MTRATATVALEEGGRFVFLGADGHRQAGSADAVALAATRARHAPSSAPDALDRVPTTVTPERRNEYVAGVLGAADDMVAEADVLVARAAAALRAAARLRDHAAAVEAGRWRR